MPLTGSHAYVEGPKVVANKIKNAILRKEGKEIVIDYEDENKPDGVPP